jgi:hypothetical protein
METRRFPPPWSAEVTPNCFIVRDADGQQPAYGAAVINRKPTLGANPIASAPTPSNC